MKKFFSVFLMVCILLTSLSVGVSASYDSTTNTYTFDTDGEVARYYKDGTWNLSDGTNSVKLGDFSRVTENKIMGKTFKKIVLDSTGSGTLTPNKASTLSIRNEMTQEKLMGAAYGITAGGTDAFTNTQLNTVLSGNKVVKNTIYAYSAKETGEPLSVDYSITVSSNPIDLDDDNMDVPASKLYSKDGIPHKIDFIVYYAGSGATNPYTTKTDIKYEIYIDGLYYSGNDVSLTGTPKTNRYSWVSPHIDISSDGTNPVTWEETEMYICSDPAGKGLLSTISDLENGAEYVTLHSLEDINEHLFQNIRYGNDNMGALRSGFATGVTSDIASDIEEVYTTAVNGDRVLEVYENVYNDPALIWDESAETSKVELYEKETNKVYTVAEKDSVEGTFDNYLISINDVYAKVAIKEPEDITYDKATKTATVRAASLPEGTESLQIVVAAYNDNGKMEDIAASTSLTVDSDDITFAIDKAEFPTNAAKYKVFVFESLTSAKPLMEALEK